MKRSEIKVGGIYKAKVSNKIVDVRVDEIQSTVKPMRNSGRYITVPTLLYQVTNLSTGRKTTFKSASKFRHEVK